MNNVVLYVQYKIKTTSGIYLEVNPLLKHQWINVLKKTCQQKVWQVLLRFYIKQKAEMVG
jgi:hypothetical protein